MKLTFSQSLLGFLTFLAVLCPVTNSASAASFFEDFEDELTPGTTIGVKSFVDREQNPDTIFPAVIDDNNGNQVLRLSDDTIPANDGAVTTSFLNVAETFNDVVVSAIFNATGDTDDQALINARIDFQNASTYAAGIDFRTGRVFLSKVVNAVIDDSFTVEKFGALDSLNSPYFVQLKVVGNAVTASFFDESGTNLITELSKVDTDPLGAGFVGLTVGTSDDNTELLDNTNNATFDDFRSQRVPEPTALLGLLGIAFLAGKISRRRSE